MSGIDGPSPQTGALMPRIYDMMVRITPLLTPGSSLLSSLLSPLLLSSPLLSPLTPCLPSLTFSQVRMNDEDIRKEYITQMEVILNE